MRLFYKKRKGRTGKCEDAAVGDGRLAEVEHLEAVQVFGDEREAAVAEVRTPEVQVAQRSQLAEVARTRGAHVCEGQRKTLQVAELPA